MDAAVPPVLAGAGDRVLADRGTRAHRPGHRLRLRPRRRPRLRQPARRAGAAPDRARVHRAALPFAAALLPDPQQALAIGGLLLNDRVVSAAVHRPWANRRCRGRTGGRRCWACCCGRRCSCCSTGCGSVAGPEPCSRAGAGSSRILPRKPRCSACARRSVSSRCWSRWAGSRRGTSACRCCSTRTTPRVRGQPRAPAPGGAGARADPRPQGPGAGGKRAGVATGRGARPGRRHPAAGGGAVPAHRDLARRHREVRRRAARRARLQADHAEGAARRRGDRALRGRSLAFPRRGSGAVPDPPLSLRRPVRARRRLRRPRRRGRPEAARRQRRCVHPRRQDRAGALLRRGLRGKLGYEKIETNVEGRALGSAGRVPATPGTDLRLGIDLDLQRAMVAAFGTLEGSAVAIDPRNGRSWRW